MEARDVATLIEGTVGSRPTFARAWCALSMVGLQGKTRVPGLRMVNSLRSVLIFGLLIVVCRRFIIIMISAMGPKIH